MLRGLLLSLTLIGGLLAAGPAHALDPVIQAPESYSKARNAVHAYLKSVPGLPPNLQVVPATGAIPWPAAHLKENIVAEVWTVVTNDGEAPRVLMMFAVRPDTGEVYALYLRSLQEHPTYGK